MKTTQTRTVTIRNAPKLVTAITLVMRPPPHNHNPRPMLQSFFCPHFLSAFFCFVFLNISLPITPVIDCPYGATNWPLHKNHISEYFSKPRNRLLIYSYKIINRTMIHNGYIRFDEEHYSSLTLLLHRMLHCNRLHQYRKDRNIQGLELYGLSHTNREARLSGRMN